MHGPAPPRAAGLAYISTSIEVKTISGHAQGGCRISNEQQLDTTGLGALFLVHQVLVRAPEGFTLGELVDELRADPLIRADLATFENSLLAYGWLDTYRGQYAHDRYTLVRRRCYAVRDGFSRLTPATLPPGISGVSYLLDLHPAGHTWWTRQRYDGRWRRP